MKRVVRRVEVALYARDNTKVLKTFRVPAPPHKAFTSDGVDDVVRNVIEMVEHLTPHHAYKLVAKKQEGKTAKFALVWDATREAEMLQSAIEDSIVSEPEPSQGEVITA